MQINVLINIFVTSLVLSTTIFAHKLTVNIAKFSSVDNTIEFSIRNDSNEVIKLPKQNLPSDYMLSRNLFDIYTAAKHIPYIGKFIKYNPKHREYIILEPHESYSIDLCLSDYYDLPPEEKITISYKKNILKHEIVQSSFSMFTSKEKGFSKIFKKASKEYNQCTQGQIDSIYNAKLLAYTISQNAYNDVYYDSKDNAQEKRYLTWFGIPNTVRKNHVKSSLKNIYTTLKDKHIAFDCSCADSNYAYVYPNNLYTIYLCSGFWSADLSGIDSQSGTIIHQLSYFKVVADTKDYSFGEYEAKNLAIEFPNYAIINADSYEYFTENKFFLTSSSFFPWLVPLLLLTN